MEKKKKILLIEDDPDTLVYISKILKREGYEVEEAENGEEGLKKFRETKPDLVVLDIMLPGIDGWEVLKRIKSGLRSRKTPVVMLTAKDTDMDKLKGYEFGADFYITKPFNMEKLLLIIRNIISEHSK
ncbi:MAG: hypothetical protein DRP67_01630 [Candidatus Omnitrophota bacterium]|nr:MAG: hypothetical protein DRP67_01630 [Candidatus Omnitrophota bacterium]